MPTEIIDTLDGVGTVDTPEPTEKLIIERKLSNPNVHPFDELEWETRDAIIGNPEDPVFKQENVEFPKTWSQNASNIVAQKYFRGPIWTGEREHSAKQMINRVANTIATWGIQDNYFDHDNFMTFQSELEYILVNQMAAFNSPVWFNVGHEKEPQCSACFILSVEDDMKSILQWNTTEGMIFKHGSGSGVNLSKLRGSQESLSKGGQASGPVSFMRGTDAWAGTIKSGGKTRRSAKMICLDVDHPDIQEFIWCKAREEKKSKALAEAGFDMSFGGKDFISIQYQNANNSVRVTNRFMEAATSDLPELWGLVDRLDNQIERQVPASGLLDEISQAAWECADPGMQYDDTINNWHTCSNTDRIYSSNPCSEYMHLDDSACNLASINLVKFLKEDGNFDVDKFKHVVDIMILAQDILIDRSSYPTDKIKKNARDYRQLGLGYANLGALLMRKGLAYDSDEGRGLAAGITYLMTGEAYKYSTKIAKSKGAYKGFEKNKEPHLNVIENHRCHIDASCVDSGPPLYIQDAGWDSWTEALKLGELYGFRNSQTTVLAPTGTISFLMDCDTTGIEPAFSLVTHKNLSGGGTLELVNDSVKQGLKNLGYKDSFFRMFEQDLEGMFLDLDPKDKPVFATAVGQNAISPMAHLKMMGAVQPFISGAISKTVNVPQETTVEQIKEIFIEGWKLGLKAVAVYRDGCKTTQAISTDAQQTEPDIQSTPTRKRLPTERESITHKFSIGGHEGYITAGMYEDGTLGEVFITDLGKNGSTINGMIQAFATAVSVGLQYGVPLETLVEKFSYMRFEPEGMTMNKEIPFAKSIPDYVMRWLSSRFLEKKELKTMLQPGEEIIPLNFSNGKTPELGSPCRQCGGIMQRTGSCYTCPACGENTGCG